MHIIIDLHSFPGGVNFLEIGEAHGQGAWCYSETNLALSYQAVEAVINFIQTSNHVGSYTLAPVNEAVDSEELLDVGRWAFNEYVQRSIYWAARVKNEVKASGEGGKKDYWSYLDLVKDGVVQPVDPLFRYE
jgi:hypothetical protein